MMGRIGTPHIAARWILILLPAFVHMGWWVYAEFAGVELQHHSVVFDRLPRRGPADPMASPREIVGTYGDIFVPDMGGRAYPTTMLVLSTTINPLKRPEQFIEWHSNVLAVEAIKYLRDDPSARNELLNGIFIQMMASNEEYLDAFLRTDADRIRDETQYLTSLCEPYYQPISRGSLLFDAGVRWIAFVPLFDVGDLVARPAERRERLRAWVHITVGRVLRDLAAHDHPDGNVQVRGVSVPALAATEEHADSHLYLSYLDSFSAIHRAALGADFPPAVENVQLVAWYKRPRSLVGLQTLHDQRRFRAVGAPLVAWGAIAAFGGIVALWALHSPSRARQRVGRQYKAALLFLLTGAANAFGTRKYFAAWLAGAGHAIGLPWSLLLDVVLGYIAVKAAERLVREPEPHEPHP